MKPNGEKYILAIDQGTTGTTVGLVNKKGEIIAKQNTEFKQIFPKPGWVEHDLEDIWQSTLKTIHRVLRQSQVSSKKIAAIGITNQRETVGLWNRRTGKPIHNAIVWQCRRTAPTCDKLKKSQNKKYIETTTGLVIDAYFSATKIKWLLDHVSGAKVAAKKGELVAGTIDTFLLWKLTGGKVHKTDISNASRTQLMNLSTGEWDKKLLKIFSIPPLLLPEICPNNEIFGYTKKITGLADGIAISGMIGDQQSALFGQTCFEAGEVKCTYGTGSFLLMNTGYKKVKSRNQLLTTVAWNLKKEKITYALEGSVFICGAAVQWLRDGLGIIKKSSEIEDLAKKVKSSDGVEFVPALTGLGAPHWQPECRGLVSGLTRGTTKAHLAYATLEAMALQNVEVLKSMEKDAGKKLTQLRVDGGACSNNLLMQMQSNFTNTPLTRPKIIETTMIGAAFMAGLGVGFWTSQEKIKKLYKKDKAFKPKWSSKQIKDRLNSWEKTIKATKNL